MWRCAVLLSVYCVGLATGQESDIDSDLLSIFNLDCGTNEYLDQCKHECPPEKTCETRKIDINCPEELMACIPKCVCKDGYYRKTEGGECIPEEECGPACGENEEYTECANPCIDDSCAAMGSLKPNCTEPCVPGCVCKKDNFRQNEYYPCWPKCYCAEHRDSPECK
ncbi:inducible metalloproteinase inhibitor protein isoform X2 [Spodoptera frugiperda]|uniref:Inducible metalloproteinase inhibitor protein isoform X2 n=1 Tax=Spodoptera frugiperda TaxID=7108 RepID=A0A9R0DLA5_SPOFR|nr:inducible metalloproteinase inhibitor protein isoform X2 [Spodoptera frugiperda]